MIMVNLEPLSEIFQSCLKTLIVYWPLLLVWGINIYTDKLLSHALQMTVRYCIEIFMPIEK